MKIRARFPLVATIATAALSLAFATSCTKAAVEETLSLDKQLLKFSYDDAIEQQVTVTSNGDWTIQVDAQDKWIKLSPTSGSAPNGTFSVSVDANSGVSRHGTINVVMAGGMKKSVVVNQAGYEEAIAIDGSNEIELSGKGESKTVKILSNTDWAVTSDVQWLTIDPAEGSKDGSVTVSAAMTTEKRTAIVFFVTTSGNRAELKVTQNALPLTEKDCAVMIGDTFIDIPQQSKGIFSGEVEIPATGSFYVQMGKKLYGFAESCGAGGLGTATKELAGQSGLPYEFLPETSQAVFKVDKSKGVMQEGGIPFWINYESKGKMRITVDAVSGSDPRYMLYKVNDDKNVIYEEKFDVLLGEGSYAIAMNTYMTPADEFAVQSIYGPWNTQTAKFTTGAFNGYFYDGGVTTTGKCVPKGLLEEMEIGDWIGTTSSFFQYQFQCLHIGGSSKPAQVYSPYFPLQATSNVEVTLDLFRMAPGTTADINLTIDGKGQITKGQTKVDYITFRGEPATQDWGLTSPVTTIALPDNEYFSHTIDWSSCGAVNNSVDKPISHMTFTIEGTDASTRLYINSGSSSARLQIHGMKVTKK